MVQLPEWNLCTGCGACSCVCPKSCIEMKQDKEGFLRPFVDKELCVICGRCEQICHVLVKQKEKKEKPIAYAIRHNNDEILKKSSSGGAFSVFADKIFEKNGVVYGAVYDSDWTVHLTRAKNSEELEVMRGSKYVQSMAGEAYLKAARDLEDGLPVLFTGLPCQIAGLYAFLGKDYTNLFTVDIVCHGAGSPGLFQSYIKYIEGKERKKVIRINHRDKKDGWSELIPIKMMRETEDGKKEYIPAFEDPYLYAFVQSMIVMPSCYHCQYACVPRIGDITMGDYGGLGVIEPTNIYCNKGISQILVNTKKGKVFFEQCDMVCEKRPLRECMMFNLNLWKPAKKHAQRDQLFQDYTELPFRELAKKYMRMSTKMKVMRKIKQGAEKIEGAHAVSKRMLDFNIKSGALENLDDIIKRIEQLQQL